MKLYVLLIGLMGLVPPQTMPGQVVALVRRVDNEVASSSGKIKIPPHKPFILFRPEELSEYEKVSLLLEGEDLSFDTGSSIPATIQNPDGFVDLEAVLGTPNAAKVRPGCLGANPEIECRAGGLPALSARVFMPYGLINPLEVDHQETNKTFVVSRVLGHNRWSFQSPISHAPQGTFLNAAANGTLLVLDVSTVATMNVGRSKIKLGKAPQSECDKIDAAGGACTIVWVMNLPEHRAGHGPAHLGDQDNHFELLYDFLEVHPKERFVPYLRMRKDLGLGGEDPPGAQCLQPKLQL